MKKVGLHAWGLLATMKVIASSWGMFMMQVTGRTWNFGTSHETGSSLRRSRSLNSGDWICHSQSFNFLISSEIAMTNIGAPLGTFKTGRSSQTHFAARIAIRLYNTNLRVRLERMSLIICDKDVVD
jgi:hypothetical protein